jgi:AhpD family alkylhydroperoxidase
MSRIKPILVNQAAGQTEQLYNAINSQLGMVPNLFQTMGVTPKVLETYLGLSSVQLSLSGAEKELIALVVSEKNGCGYCLSAHTVLGKLNKLSDDEIILARKGQSKNVKYNSLLMLVAEVISNKGNVSDDTIAQFKANGYSTNQLPEIMLAVVQNIFTNYLNNLNRTEIDFPIAPKI